MSNFLHVDLQRTQHDCNVATLLSRRSARLLQRRPVETPLRGFPAVLHGTGSATLLSQNAIRKFSRAPLAEFPTREFLHVRGARNSAQVRP